MRIPTTGVPSVTTTEPIWRLSITEVASVSDASATGDRGEDISSWTAVGMDRSSVGPGGLCRRWSGRCLLPV